MQQRTSHRDRAELVCQDGQCRTNAWQPNGAIGVAISPVPIIAEILMLGTGRAPLNGPAFALGWILGLVIVSIIDLLVARRADDVTPGARNAVDVAKLVRSRSGEASAGRSHRNGRAGTPDLGAAVDQDFRTYLDRKIGEERTRRVARRAHERLFVARFGDASGAPPPGTAVCSRTHRTTNPLGP